MEQVGYFWLPTTPEMRISGVLSSDEGLIRLTLNGTLSGSPIRTTFGHQTIHGHLSGVGWLILPDFAPSGSNFKAGVSIPGYGTESYIGVVAFLQRYGDSPSIPDHYKFFCAETDGVFITTGKSRVEADFSGGSNGALSWDNSSTICRLQSETHVVEFISRMHINGLQTERHVIHDRRFVQITPRNTDVATVDSGEWTSQCICRLICLSTGIFPLERSFDAVAGAGEISVIRPGRSGDVKNLCRGIQPLFQLTDLPQGALGKWMDLHEACRPMCDLFFELYISSPRTTESRFLYLARALDSITSMSTPKEHYEKYQVFINDVARALDGNANRERVLAKLKALRGIPYFVRLRDTLAGFPDSYRARYGAADAVAEKIQKIRNHYSHMSDADFVVNIDEMGQVISAMHSAVKVIMLRTIGFDDNAINAFSADPLKRLYSH